MRFQGARFECCLLVYKLVADGILLLSLYLLAAPVSSYVYVGQSCQVLEGSSGVCGLPLQYPQWQTTGSIHGF